MPLVRPKKSLGQHFLKDLQIAQRIADTVDACPQLPILEVGPGMGVLTQFLIPKKRNLKVVELDMESVEFLQEHFPEIEDKIIANDFLKMDLNEIFDGKPFVLTGNYPYNISSQIFFKMLLPLIKPGLVSAALLAFIFAWNTFTFPLLLAGSKIQPITVAITKFLGTDTAHYGQLAVAATVSALPAIIFALCIQKHLVRGLSFGAVKG